MASRATDALPVFALFAPAFTPATFSRAQLLAVAAILTTGRRTVTNLLRTLGHLVVSGCGHWYKGGAGLVEVRWVYVHDRTGTHRDEYFYTTDLRLMPPEVIEAYAARWKVETTFAEMRSYLDLETTRGWCARTVLRAEPCLFGLYSVVASLYEQLPAESQAEVGGGMGGQDGGDVLRRHHGRAALAVDEMGF